MWNLRVVAIMLLLIIYNLIFTFEVDNSADDLETFEILEVNKKGEIS